jgi:hypothetical protein
VLLLPGAPDPGDLTAIRSAAASLLAVLAERGLITDPETHEPPDDPRQ